MGNKREFEIAFVGLKPGIHEYSYHVDNKFFANYSQADFSDCEAVIKLKLEKNTNFMLLKFEIGGTVNVTCDRCGNLLPMDLWDEFNMVVKQVDNPAVMNDNEADPDIFYISMTESHLHVADWIYEFVALSIPMQRMCDESEIGRPQCNAEVLSMLKKMESRTSNHHPLQAGLEKLKKKTK